MQQPRGISKRGRQRNATAEAVAYRRGASYHRRQSRRPSGALAAPRRRGSCGISVAGSRTRRGIGTYGPASHHVGAWVSTGERGGGARGGGGRSGCVTQCALRRLRVPAAGEQYSPRRVPPQAKHPPAGEATRVGPQPRRPLPPPQQLAYEAARGHRRSEVALPASAAHGGQLVADETQPPHPGAEQQPPERLWQTASMWGAAGRAEEVVCATLARRHPHGGRAESARMLCRPPAEHVPHQCRLQQQRGCLAARSGTSLAEFGAAACSVHPQALPNASD